MILAQITDLHIQEKGATRSDGTDTAVDLTRCIDAVNRLAPQPDLILITGDLTEDGEEAQYRHLAEHLARIRAPYYLIPGNHDDRTALRLVFGDLPYDPPGSPFMHYTLDVGPMRVVALDTLEPGEEGGTLCTERLSWLEAVLDETPERPILLCLHHPPFPTRVPYFDSQGFEGLGAFRKLMDRNPQVRRIVSGHTHRSMTAQVGHAVASTCPSPTFSFEVELRPGMPGRPSGESGGFQLHVWHEGADFTTHTILLNGAG